MLRASAIVTAAWIVAAALAMPGAAAAPADQLADVPGMAHGVELSTGCSSWERYIFGRGDTGQTYACHYIPNQWPPVQTGFWVWSPPLYGVQQIGTPVRRPGPRGRTVPGRTCVGVHRIPGLATGFLRLSHQQRDSEEQRHAGEAHDVIATDRTGQTRLFEDVVRPRAEAHGITNRAHREPDREHGKNRPGRSTTTRTDGRPLSQSPKRPTERASPGRSDDSSGATSLSRGGSSR